MRINDLVGETTEYDKKLKVELRKPKSWCKSISAFANTLGGALIFGISDENEIIGVNFDGIRCFVGIRFRKN